MKKWVLKWLGIQDMLNGLANQIYNGQPNGINHIGSVIQQLNRDRHYHGNMHPLTQVEKNLWDKIEALRNFVGVEFETIQIEDPSQIKIRPLMIEKVICKKAKK